MAASLVTSENPQMAAASATIDKVNTCVRVLCEMYPVIRICLLEDQAALNGSFLWRTIRHINAASTFNERKIVGDVLNEISVQLSDIDLFIMPKSAHMFTTKRNGASSAKTDEWIDYPGQAADLAAAKSMVAESKVRSIYDLVELVKSANKSQIRNLSRNLLPAKHIMAPLIKSDVHFSHYFSPTEMLTTRLAPCLRVESLVWTAERGLFTRYEIPIEDVFSDIQKREIHLAHPKELIFHYHDKGKTLNIMAWRLIKYKGHKFSLPSEFTSDEHVGLSLIMNNIPYLGIIGLGARYSESLYEDFVKATVMMVCDQMPAELASMIAGYT